MVKKSRNNLIKINKKNFQRFGEFFDLTTVGYIAKPSYILKTRDLFNGKVKSIEILEIGLSILTASMILKYKTFT